MRIFARAIQIGNPYNKAPTLLKEPTSAERFSGPYADTNNLYTWKINKAVCSSLYFGAVINSNNSVYYRFTSFPWGKDLHPIFFLPYIGRTIMSVESGFFLMTIEAEGNYFHWMIDLLPRLLILTRNSLGNIKNPYIILHSKKRSYELQTLKLLGFNEDKIIRLKAFDLVNANNLYITDYQPTYEKTPFSKWKKELLIKFRDETLKTVSTEAFRKVYLLRGNQGKRRLIGEEQLVEILSKVGFEIIDPQRLTVVEQMETLTGAKVVVALHGAALTNIIFCKKETLIIELRSSNLPPEYFSEIAKTCNLRFESISIPPEHIHKDKHVANKENLILNQESINLLRKKLNDYNLEH